MTEGISLEHYDNDFEVKSLLRKLKSVSVRHHQTCECGKTLVNLYYRDAGPTASVQQQRESWKCKKCWDQYDQEELEFRKELKFLVEEDVSNEE
jgi:hypothetical protein